MEKFLESRQHQAATKECDRIAVNIGEWRVGVSEKAGHDRAPGHAGNYGDVIEELEVFESAQRAEVKCNGARSTAGQRQSDRLVERRRGRGSGNAATDHKCHLNSGRVLGQLPLFERVGTDLRLWVGGVPDDHHQLMGTVTGCCREYGADAGVVDVAGLGRADGMRVPGSDVTHDAMGSVFVVPAQIARAVRSADKMVGGELAVLGRSADIGQPCDPQRLVELPEQQSAGFVFR